jgi:CMP-N-acetylneuraminic acid synthetase
LLIIPARGGSKRIKSKNTKLLNGKPIIAYTIETAKKSKLFSEIHISTESIKIANLCAKLKFPISFLRKKELSNDKAKLTDVFKFVVKKYKSEKKIFSEIWFMTPCSPLIEPIDLINASKFFNKIK